MTDAAQDLLDRALQLSLKDRAALARDLILSLEDQGEDDREVDADAFWREELRRRVERAKAGEPGIPAEVVLTEARARLEELRGQ